MNLELQSSKTTKGTCKLNAKIYKQINLKIYSQILQIHSTGLISCSHPNFFSFSNFCANLFTVLVFLAVAESLSRRLFFDNTCFWCLSLVTTFLGRAVLKRNFGLSSSGMNEAKIKSEINIFENFKIYMYLQTTRFLNIR